MLSAALTATDRTTLSRDALGGIPAQCVLSLAETHHVLYAAYAGAELSLLWQDATTSPPSMVCKMTLSPDERARWLDALPTLAATHSSTAR